jgi:hypothetical protein
METEERWCGHCQADTQQRGHDSGHERDSSGDFWECLTCHWYYTGYTGKWEPPLNLEQHDGPS